MAVKRHSKDISGPDRTLRNLNAHRSLATNHKGTSQVWASNFTRVISEQDLASTGVPKNLSSFNLEAVHIYRVDVCIRPRDFDPSTYPTAYPAPFE